MHFRKEINEHLIEKAKLSNHLFLQDLITKQTVHTVLSNSSPHLLVYQIVWFEIIVRGDILFKLIALDSDKNVLIRRKGEVVIYR